MKNLYTFFLLFLLSLPLAGQVTFQKTYGFGSELSSKILPVIDGYIMLSTYNFTSASDVMVIKTDLFGNVLWSKTYGGIQSEDCWGIDSTYDGGYIIAGYTNSFTGLDPNDFDYVLLFKIDSAGNLLWSNIIEIDELDVATSVKETFDHGFVLAGWSGMNVFVVKTDSIGGIEWSKVYGSANFARDIGRAVIQTRDSGYAVVGITEDIFTTDTSAILIKTDASGMALFTHHYKIYNSSVSDDVTYANDLIQDSDGNLLFTGGTGKNIPNLLNAYAPYIIKTDSVGNYITSKIYSLNSTDSRGYSLREVPGKGYIMGGTMGEYYPFMLNVNSILDNNWCYYYGSFSSPIMANGGFGFDAQNAMDGGFVLTGYRSFNSPAIFSALIKTDSLGQSGCNQGIPSFGGNSTSPTYTHVYGTVFSSGSATFMPVVLSVTDILLPDSTICTSTSIENIQSLNFRLFPNPVHDKLIVEFPIKTENALLELSDCTGKKILHQNVNSIINEINIAHLSKGVYIVKFFMENELLTTKRFVKL